MQDFFTIEQAAVEWHTDAETAQKWLEQGAVQFSLAVDGLLLIPVGEVARWQGVLGQNGRLG